MNEVNLARHARRMERADCRGETGPDRCRRATGAALALALMAAFVSSASAAPGDVLQRLRDGLGGTESLAAIQRFDYRLQLRAPDGTLQRDVRYRLHPASGALCARSQTDGVTRYWDGAAGWRLGNDGRRVQLGEEEAESLAAHSAYNFVRLLRDPRTHAEPRGDRVRIHPHGQDAFEVSLDARDRIVANHFDDGTEVAEQAHLPVGGVEWPMRFVLRSGPRSGAVGEFSEVRVVRSGDDVGADECGMDVERTE